LIGNINPTFSSECRYRALALAANIEKQESSGAGKYTHGPRIGPDPPVARAKLSVYIEKSGTTISRDYRAKIVLAAHELVSELDLGIIAKVDLLEKTSHRRCKKMD
jgi:hypothetical protein